MIRRARAKSCEKARFGKLRPSGDFGITANRHLRAASRPLCVSCELKYDNAISGFMSADMLTPRTPLPLADE
jgi:hypothetical protein